MIWEEGIWPTIALLLDSNEFLPCASLCMLLASEEDPSSQLNLPCLALFT